MPMHNPTSNILTVLIVRNLEVLEEVHYCSARGKKAENKGWWRKRCEIATASRIVLLIPNLNVWTPDLGPMVIPAISSYRLRRLPFHRKAVHTMVGLYLSKFEEHELIANIAIDGH